MVRALCCFVRQEAVSDGGASSPKAKLDTKTLLTAENEVEARKLDTKIAVPEQNHEEVVDPSTAKNDVESQFDKAASGADSVQPSDVVVPAVERSRFDGLWTNHDNGEVHTVEGSSCSAGKFTADSDGIHCSLDVHGEVRRGELSSDGRTIAWENDEMWFCEAPEDLDAVVAEDAPVTAAKEDAPPAEVVDEKVSAVEKPPEQVAGSKRGSAQELQDKLSKQLQKEEEGISAVDHIGPKEGAMTKVHTELRHKLEKQAKKADSGEVEPGVAGIEEGVDEDAAGDDVLAVEGVGVEGVQAPLVKLDS